MTIIDWILITVYVMSCIGSVVGVLMIYLPPPEGELEKMIALTEGDPKIKNWARFICSCLIPIGNTVLFTAVLVILFKRGSWSRFVKYARNYRKAKQKVDAFEENLTL